MLKKVRDEFRSFFSLSTKTTFIVTLLIMGCLFTLYNMKKSIVICIDGEENKVTTFRRDLKSTLFRENINLGPYDKITPGIDSKLKDGDRVYIERAIKVSLLADGKETEIYTTDDTLEDMFCDEGIKLNELDKVEPMLTSPLKDGMTVSITRVETQVMKEYTSIDFSTVIKNDDSLLNTVKKVTQEGETGEKEITLRVMFENGKEVSRNIISEVVTKQPTQKVLIQGTLSALNLSRGGEAPKKESAPKKASAPASAPTTLGYKSVIQCRATAYSAQEPGMGTRTASGTTVRRNPSGYSTLAVDPRVIPLGTKVYVEGYGYAIAEDTGGAIKGNKIDVYMNTVAECYNWGVRNVNVYILP